MPVTLSLELLVSTPGTRPLWPSTFAALIAELEKQPDEMTQWGVLADWLKEHEEYGLEDACRWFVKHEEVSVQKDHYSGWKFHGLPMAVGSSSDPDGDRSTVAGAIAMLAARLRRAREAVA